MKGKSLILFIVVAIIFVSFGTNVIVSDEAVNYYAGVSIYGN